MPTGFLPGGYPTGWPDSTNTGYLNAPGYPGSLTPSSGPFVDNTTYSFLLIDSGASTTAGTSLTGANMTFIGCQFASNDRANYNVNMASGASATFSYCSFTPRPAIVTAPPGGFVWPSRSSGKIALNDGYQYGVEINASAGPVTMNHCDMWGFANAVDIHGRTQTNYLTITNCWFHDTRDDDGGTDHSDGPGDISGLNVAQSYITISHNTIASMANANAIAFQGASAAYDHLIVTNNYLTGFGYNTDIGHAYSGCTNMQLTDNTFATDNQWIFGPIYSDPTTLFTGSTNVWRRNVFKVIGGTSPAGTAVYQWVSGDNGKYVLPNSSISGFSVTDFTG